LSRRRSEQPARAQLQEEESEFRILEIELLDLIIGDDQKLARLHAFERLGSRLGGGQETQLAHDVAGKNIDPDIRQPEFARHDESHVGCRLALAEQHVSGSRAAGGGERLEPVHVEVALGRALDLPHQHQHLAEPEDVQRQQSQMQHEQGIGGVEIAVGDEEDIARDADDAQRHHRLHREGQEHQKGGDVTKGFGDGHREPLCREQGAEKVMELFDLRAGR
jgi:hypothetical protein